MTELQMPSLSVAREILLEIAHALCANEKAIEFAAGAVSPPRVKFEIILAKEKKPVKKVLLRLESTVHLG